MASLIRSIAETDHSAGTKTLRYLNHNGTEIARFMYTGATGRVTSPSRVTPVVLPLPDYVQAIRELQAWRDDVRRSFGLADKGATSPFTRGPEGKSATQISVVLTVGDATLSDTLDRVTGEVTVAARAAFSLLWLDFARYAAAHSAFVVEIEFA